MLYNLTIIALLMNVLILSTSKGGLSERDSQILLTACIAQIVVLSTFHDRVTVLDVCHIIFGLTLLYSILFSRSERVILYGSVILCVTLLARVMNGKEGSIRCPFDVEAPTGLINNIQVPDHTADVLYGMLLCIGTFRLYKLHQLRE